MCSGVFNSVASEKVKSLQNSFLQSYEVLAEAIKAGDSEVIKPALQNHLEVAMGLTLEQGNQAHITTYKDHPALQIEPHDELKSGEISGVLSNFARGMNRPSEVNVVYAPFYLLKDQALGMFDSAHKALVLGKDTLYEGQLDLVAVHEAIHRYYYGLLEKGHASPFSSIIFWRPADKLPRLNDLSTYYPAMSAEELVTHIKDIVYMTRDYSRGRNKENFLPRLERKIRFSLSFTENIRRATEEARKILDIMKVPSPLGYDAGYVQVPNKPRQITVFLKRNQLHPRLEFQKFDKNQMVVQMQSENITLAITLRASFEGWAQRVQALGEARLQSEELKELSTALLQRIQFLEKASNDVQAPLQELQLFAQSLPQLQEIPVGSVRVLKRKATIPRQALGKYLKKP